MIKFCPMCGTKISEQSKFCLNCGLNLSDYQQKLDRLVKQKTPADNSNTKQNVLTINSDKIVNRQSFNVQDFILRLAEKYGSLNKVYFNIQNQRNLTKIQAAKNAYARGVKNENVIFVLDDTVFGGADDGFLVTDKKIYIHNIGQDLVEIQHNQIESFTVRKVFFDRHVLINENIEISITGYNQLEVETMIVLLNEIKSTCAKQTPVSSVVTTVSVDNASPVNIPPTSSRPPVSAKSRYFTSETYVCENPEAERFYQLARSAKTMEESAKYLGYAMADKHVVATYDSALLGHMLMLNKPDLEEDSKIQYFNDVKYSAEAGLIEGMILLGNFYCFGLGTDKDYRKALEWYEKGLNAGYNGSDVDTIIKKVNLIKKILADRQSTYDHAMNEIDEIFLHKRPRRMLKELADKIPLKCIYYHTMNCDQKTEDKINLAMKHYSRHLATKEYPLVCFDSTVFGSAENGCLFTTKGIYIHNDGESMRFVDYNDIAEDQVKLRGIIMKDMYIGECKIQTSVCAYSDEEQSKFRALIILMKRMFGS